MQFIAIANYYDYFGDYEIPLDEGFIKEEDLLYACQEMMLPPIYKSYIIK